MNIKIEKFKDSTNPIMSLFGTCYVCGASQYDDKEFMENAIILNLNGPSDSCNFCLCKDCANNLYLQLAKYI